MNNRRHHCLPNFNGPRDSSKRRHKLIRPPKCCWTPPSPPHVILRWVSVADQTQPVCGQTSSVGCLHPELKSDGVKEDRRRPRNISRVSDNPVEIPDGCSMSTNTSVNILQYHDCQINAKRRKDKMHPRLYLSSIMAASHRFIHRQPALMIISFRLSALWLWQLHHWNRTLGRLWKKKDLDRPPKSQDKPSEVDVFQPQSGSVYFYLCHVSPRKRHQWDFQIDVWPEAHLPKVMLTPVYTETSAESVQETLRSPARHETRVVFYSARGWNQATRYFTRNQRDGLSGTNGNKLHLQSLCH